MPQLEAAPLEGAADGVKVLTDLRSAGQRLEVLQMASRVLLILSDVVDDVCDHHGEPTKHGDKHGHVRGLMVEVTEVDPRVQHLDQRLSRVLVLHRRVADDLIDRVGVQPQLPQDLLQRALAVPRVVGQADLCPQVGKHVLRDTLDVVVGQVQYQEADGKTLERPNVHGLNLIVGQIHLLEIMQFSEGVAGNMSDVIGRQQQNHRLLGELRGDLVQVSRNTLDHRVATLLYTVTAVGTGSHWWTSED